MLAVGNAFTVTVADPPWFCAQVVALASSTLTREYVKIPASSVGTGILILVFIPEVEII